MSLTNYRSLGRSGLIVSPMALGTMTFGTKPWGVDKDVAREIFKTYVENGGNFVDTADIYSLGVSEEMTGEFIREMNLRDQIVLSTKFAFNGSSSPLSTNHSLGNPNAGGSGAKNIHRALDASLKRLKVDYIDLYWMHIWDGVTPVEEIIQTLQDLVTSGKIRYYALSDMPAWLAMKAATISNERRRPQPIAIQFEYSLVAREIEREHVPMAIESGMGIMPWSPLAGGFLSGKYKRSDTSNTGRLSGANPFGDSKFSDQNWLILDELKKVSDELDCTTAQAALAWLMLRPGVSSTLIGASKVSQLKDNLAALDMKLTIENIERLDRVSARTMGFSDSLTTPEIRKMVYGGNAVIGWGQK
ncbi:MAG: aldo/keto reductase [Bdellovibrio sp.]|nr:aldo/keto reductase [Bdellovibrio sp.]